jgi:hypothetical protein
MRKKYFSKKAKTPVVFEKRNIVLILTFLLAVVFAGCATTKTGPVTKPTPPAKGEALATVQQVEDLNPEVLPDSIFQVQQKVPLSKEETQTVREQGQAEEVPREVVVEKPGYRVQIAALSSQDEAMQIKKEAMLKFGDQGVYLIFDPPFYKIRVGDFVSRYDAEKLQQKAIQLGYKDAWIVRTRVKIRKTE